jgi:glycosyltransferase involved in cell wall biosynthesis
MKADIIHISGFDTYNTHDSGNYIVFNFLRQLKEYDSKMILCMNKQKTHDKDTFYIPKNKVYESIKECKILIIHDELFSIKEIEKFYKKLNCNIVMITQTHYHLITSECIGNNAHPELNDKEANDHNDFFISQKRKIIKNLPISLVHGSSYTGRITKKYNMFDNMTLIPLPDDVPFCKSSKEKTRKFLRLPLDKKIIFWGTSHPKTKRKGKFLFDQCLDFLWDSLDNKQREDIIILNVGPPAGKFGINSAFSVLPTGYIKTRKEMSVYYRASDISVCTTIADAGPMMISESMCNETPVIAFDRSISCDLCDDGKTGYLVKDLNTENMAKSIYNSLYVDDLTEMSKKSREKYLTFHDKGVILSRWNNLFSELMEKE